MSKKLKENRSYVQTQSSLSKRREQYYRNLNAEYSATAKKVHQRPEVAAQEYIASFNLLEELGGRSSVPEGSVIWDVGNWDAAATRGLQRLFPYTFVAINPNDPLRRQQRQDEDGVPFIVGRLESLGRSVRKKTEERGLFPPKVILLKYVLSYIDLVAGKISRELAKDLIVEGLRGIAEAIADGGIVFIYDFSPKLYLNYRRVFERIGFTVEEKSHTPDVDHIPGQARTYLKCTYLENNNLNQSSQS